MQNEVFDILLNAVTIKDGNGKLILRSKVSKTVLLIVGILVILIGIAGLVPSWTWAAVATWLAIVEIIIGVIAAGVSLMDKKT